MVAESKWLNLLMSEMDTAEDVRVFARNHYGGFDAKSLSRLVILGAAGEGRRLADICAERGIEVVAAIDDDPSMVGQKWPNCTVGPSSNLDLIDKDIPVVIASHRTFNATKQLRSIGHTTVVPFMLLQMQDPSVFRPHMFYTGIVESLVADKRLLLETAARLADEKSVEVLDAAIGYRLTGDPVVFASVLEELPYFPDDMYTFESSSVYVDGGAFDGDSVKSFVDRAGENLDAVFAFEPDPVTHKLLSDNFVHDSRIHAINKGLYSGNAEFRFKADGTRGALFDANGEQTITVTSIDSFLAGGRADFIKLNIEGFEIDAIWGAERTIRDCAPNMAISAYHHPCDLWRVPDVVARINPNLELFMRQQDGGIIETVLCTRAK